MDLIFIDLTKDLVRRVSSDSELLEINRLQKKCPVFWTGQHFPLVNTLFILLRSDSQSLHLDVPPCQT